MSKYVTTLVETVQNALEEVQAYNEIAVINYGNIDEQIPKALEAFEELTLLLQEMEVYFYSMTDDGYNLKRLRSLHTWDTFMAVARFKELIARIMAILEFVPEGEAQS